MAVVLETISEIVFNLTQSSVNEARVGTMEDVLPMKVHGRKQGQTLTRDEVGCGLTFSPLFYTPKATKRVTS